MSAATVGARSGVDCGAARLVGLAVGYVGAVSSFSAAANAQPVPPDILHSLKARPRWMDAQEAAADASLSDMCIAAFLVAFALTLVSHPHAALTVAEEFMIIHDALMFLLGTLLALTSLPSPSPVCRFATSRPLTGTQPQACNDLMRSGHTCMYTTVSFLVANCAWSLRARLAVFVAAVGAIMRRHGGVNHRPRPLYCECDRCRVLCVRDAIRGCAQNTNTRNTNTKYKYKIYL